MNRSRQEPTPSSPFACLHAGRDASFSMPSLLQGLCLLLLMWLTACGAQWRSFQDEPPAARHFTEAEAGFESSERAHGHRDFPRPFAVVWAATAQTLHTQGIGVPRSARPAGKRGEIDLDGIHVLVEERYAGRTCVILRFRALEDEAGEKAAGSLLDAIQERL